MLTALGALGGFVAVAILVVSGGLGPGAAPLLVWFGLVTAAYAIICAFLTFSAGVRREIRRASGQM